MYLDFVLSEGRGGHFNQIAVLRSSTRGMHVSSVLHPRGRMHLKLQHSWAGQEWRFGVHDQTVGAAIWKTHNEEGICPFHSANLLTVSGAGDPHHTCSFEKDALLCSAEVSHPIPIRGQYRLVEIAIKSALPKHAFIHAMRISHSFKREAF